MAGLGFKDFQVGEVLTSSDVDGYLMQQTVMRFADAGARGSALGTATGTAVPLAEGMVTYLDNANALQVFNGTSWTSPLPGIGMNVVQSIRTTSFSTTSSSFQDVPDVSVTITPSTTSSKVLVLVEGVTSGNTINFSQRLNLVRGSTSIAQSTGGTLQQTVAVYNNNTANGIGFSMSVLDSPATTSATTYKLQVASGGTPHTSYVGRYAANDDLRSVTFITAIEVAA